MSDLKARAEAGCGCLIVECRTIGCKLNHRTFGDYLVHIDASGCIVRDLLAECERLEGAVDSKNKDIREFNDEISRLRGENERMDADIEDHAGKCAETINGLEADLSRHKKLVERLREVMCVRGHSINSRLYNEIDTELREFERP